MIHAYTGQQHAKAEGVEISGDDENLGLMRCAGQQIRESGHSVSVAGLWLDQHHHAPRSGYCSRDTLFTYWYKSSDGGAA